MHHYVGILQIRSHMISHDHAEYPSLSWYMGDESKHNNNKKGLCGRK